MSKFNFWEVQSSTGTCSYLAHVLCNSAFSYLTIFSGEAESSCSVTCFWEHPVRSHSW